MRIWIFSDFHLEHGTLAPESVVSGGAPEADLCLCAGDFHQGARSIAELGRLVVPHMPVVTVLGNHEHYDGEYHQTRAECRAAALDSEGVTLLDPGMTIIGDLRIVGATLWTDYELHGVAHKDEAMAKARHLLTDHDVIRHRNADRTVQAWSPYHARRYHEDELSRIIGFLSSPFDGKTVVLTHHAPHPNSIHPRFLDPSLAAANVGFASDLTRVIERFQPDLWVHGHMHNCSDYLLGGTRVIANPRGYTRRDGAVENTGFDPRLIIEI